MKINAKKIIPVILSINLAVYSGLSYVLIYSPNPYIKAQFAKVKDKPANFQKVEETAEKIVDKPKVKNRFPFGQCTWYVATRRNVTWGGNAIDWFKNAKNAGRSIGRVPKKGAILVTRESWYGHVSYVENVIGDNFTVSEMNNPIWGKVTKRNLTIREVPFVGFIY